MSVPLPSRPVLAVLAAFLVPVTPLAANPNRAGHSSAPSVTQCAKLAHAVLSSPRIEVLDYHVSGTRDEATAKHNLVQTARGHAARRSYYGNGPGGSTRLCAHMLHAICQLAREGHSFRITELAGGSHASTSRHYAGVAFDIDFLNGHKIGTGHPTYRRFLKRCRELGATEVFGPGAHGHSSHLHIAWPLPDGDRQLD